MWSSWGPFMLLQMALFHSFHGWVIKKMWHICTVEYCSPKTYVLGDHYVLSLPCGLYLQIPKTSCIINSLWILPISTDCLPILLQIQILIESKESTPYAHPLIILPDQKLGCLPWRSQWPITLASNFWAFSVYFESESRSVMFNSLRLHGLYSPWNSPGQNTGVGSLSFLQGIFPTTQGWNPGLPHCRQILYQLSHKGSPCISCIMLIALD